MNPFLLAQAQSAGTDLIDRLARTPLSQIVLVVAVCTVVRLAVYPILKGALPGEKSALLRFAKILNEISDAIVYAGIFVFLLIRPFGIQTFKIPTGSMLDTLQLQDHIVANKAIYRYSEPKFGDIVVFRPPTRALYEFQLGQDIDFIKRLIGLPGDVIEIREDVLYRNGDRVDEPYVVYKSGPEGLPRTELEMAFRTKRSFKLVEKDGEFIPVNYVGDIANDLNMVVDEYVVTTPAEMRDLLARPPAAIPPGHLLFVGDNRDFSSDGRMWGLARRDEVIGRAEFIWLPVNRWRSVR